MRGICSAAYAGIAVSLDSFAHTRVCRLPMIGDAIAGVVGKIIDRAWPDPSQKAAAAIELQKMVQAGEFKQIDADLQLAQMQADVNKVEAGSADHFTSRWRPSVGYVCAAGLAYAAILEPCARLFVVANGVAVDLPAVDTTLTMQLLLGLLGLGGMRSAEKLKRAA